VFGIAPTHVQDLALGLNLNLLD